MLIAVLCWALYSVGMKKMAGRFPASPFLLVQVTVALVVLIPSSSIEWMIKAPHVTLESRLGERVIVCRNICVHRGIPELE